jgi:hypothetical protein
MSRTTLILLAAAVLTVSPLAGAWSGKGDSEPSTSRDANDGYMFPTADTSPCSSASDVCDVNQVYLNGFYGQCAGISCTNVDPNVASVGSSVQASDVIYEALFGIWKDCNGDGFIGLSETGDFEYRTEVLNAQIAAGLAPAGVCPVQPKMPTDHLNHVLPDSRPPFNDGTWVHEFVPIAWRDIDASTKAGVYDTNPYDINDNNARVWADFGLPESFYGGSGCPIVPQERGTYASTGGLLHTYDCLAAYHVTDTFDGVADGNAALQPYSFSDHSRDQQNSASKANIANPWGQQGDASYVGSPWNCGAGQVKSVPLGADPVFGSYLWVNVSQPGTSGLSPNTGGSAAGTMNATGSGFDTCHRNTDGNGDAPQGLVWSTPSNWHEGAALATAPYMLEYDVAATPFKVQADDNLAPSIESRPPAPYATALGSSTPSGGDIVPFTTGDGIWSGNTAWSGTFMVNRQTLSAGGVSYHTFYGYTSLGKTTLGGGVLTVPKVGTYGAESCGSFTTGVHNGWQCDPTKWYVDSLGNDINVRSTALGHDPNKPADLVCSSSQNIDAGCIAYGARVGDPYNVRDIDCYDQSASAARDAGVSWGVVTNTAC